MHLLIRRHFNAIHYYNMPQLMVLGGRSLRPQQAMLSDIFRVRKFFAIKGGPVAYSVPTKLHYPGSVGDTSRNTTLLHLCQN